MASPRLVCPRDCTTSIAARAATGSTSRCPIPSRLWFSFVTRSPFHSLAVIEGAKPPSSASGEAASREGRQRPYGLLSLSTASLLPARSKQVVRCSPRLRRCSSVTRSANRRVWPSVHLVGVGHSEPPVKGSRLWSLEPLCPRRVQVSTQKQEAPTSTSEGRVGPSAVGRSSSPSPNFAPCNTSTAVRYIQLRRIRLLIYDGESRANRHALR